MRTIKFRAWNGNSMLSWEWMPGMVSLWEVLQGENYTPMQYTGLTDRAGKEIYEGDVVTNHDAEKFVVEFSDGGFYCVRYSADGKPVVTMLEPFGLGHVAIDDEQIQVIGNLFENPSLLDDSRRRDERLE